MIYEFEDFCLDVAKQELRRGATRIEVEPQVLALLQHIICNRERVVSKDDLIAHVWQGRIVSDSTMTSRITAARKALSDDGGQQRLIRTVSRRGLRFVGDVRAAALPGNPFIAVLPFTNLSGDPAQDLFGDGIAEDLITALARYPSFPVIARNSSFAYRGRALDLRQIGRELGVRYLLVGSLRTAAGCIRVSAQLIEAETGHHVWGERFDRDLADIFRVQDEIVHASTTAMAPAIASAEQRRALRRSPESLDAWGAYQRGMWHMARASPAEDRAALRWFERSIESDPIFAGGHIGVSAVLSRSKGTHPAELAAARQAVAVDAGNAEARARLALALLAGGAHQAALEQAEESLRLCPNLAAGHGALGVTLAYTGRPLEGVTALRTCLRLDPGGPYLVNRLNQVALAHFFARDLEEAVAAAQRAVTAFPDFSSPYRWLAAALGALGRCEEGRTALAQAISASSSEFDFQVRRRPPWFRPEDHAQMLEGLRLAGWAG